MPMTSRQLAEPTAETVRALPSVAPGSRWSGMLDALPDEAPALPCTIVRGAADGPTLLVTAGIHGAEYASIAAAQHLARTPADRLRGTLIVAPIINTSAYFARSIYVTPLDGKNLNRVFPGNPEGSASERLAHWLVETLLRHADAYLDLHGGDLIEALTPFAIHSADDPDARALANAFALPYRIEEHGEGMTFAAAHSLGVPAVLAEAGGQGLWPSSVVQLLEDGARRALKHLGMTETAPAPTGTPELVTNFAWTRSDAAGCWYPAVEVGQQVAVGELLGHVTDLLGAPVQEARCSAAGTVLFAVTSLAINRGDPLVGIGA
ncbi:MAG TPA: succinylglutamate desuccinylase/aspartoacylase family protein [Trueperaceae bacterium]